MGVNPSESNAAADVLLTKNPTTTQYRGNDEEATEKSEEPDTSNVQGNRSFRLDATARRVTGGAGCYDVTITAYSAAVDFSGYIRMSIINSSDDSIAYDTRINLPEKTEKSFVLRIPNEGYFDINFKVIISILDENMNEVYTLNSNDLFVKADEEAVFVGVLSSDFDKLSYLAIDGWELDRLKDRYEVRLVELNENNIIDELDRLSYIVIDDYDTSKLDASTIKQIENYVQSGGILFLGTGKNEDKTLKGFGKDYIDAEITGHGLQQTYVYTMDAIQDLTCSTINYGYSYSYTSYSIPGMYKRDGKGVILLSEISFLDPDFYNLTAVDQLVYNTYVDSYNSSGFYYDDQTKGVSLSSVQQYFKSIEGFKKVSIGGLKWIVFIYVLIIGPVLYIILRKTNKREYFWIAIPAVTIIFIGVIMIYGGRFRLSNKNAANVTVASADGKGLRRTYMSIFSSKSGDISVNLNETINGLGPVFKEYGNYNGRNITDYHVKYDGGQTQISHDGDSSFDKGYLIGLSENHPSGRLSLQYSTGWSIGIGGTLNNETEYDFDYVLIKKGSEVVVVKGLEAGDILAVSSNIVYSGYYYWAGDNAEVAQRYKDSKKVDYRKLAALFLALDDVSSKGDYVIIGLTSEYDTFTKGDVNELSYGCIYSIGTIE